jgi:MFS family permease
VGGLLLAFVTAGSRVWYVLLSCLVLGFGMGWVNAPITNSAVAGMPRARAGTAAGIASTSRQVGSSLGVAVVGSILTAGLHGSFASGFAAATRPAWWLVAAMGVAVFALALVTTSRAGNASAARTAELIEQAERPVPARAA